MGVVAEMGVKLPGCSSMLAALKCRMSGLKRSMTIGPVTFWSAGGAVLLEAGLVTRRSNVTRSPTRAWPVGRLNSDLVICRGVQTCWPLETWAGALTARREDLDAIIAGDPTPEFVAVMSEQYDNLLEKLGDDDLRQVAIHRMEGYDRAEIAQLLGCAVRTVARRMELIRKTWAAETE